MSHAVPDMSQWIASWRAAAARLERLRAEELARVDVAHAIETLEDAFIAARRHQPPSMTSGLVEQQAWFMKGLA